MGVLSAWVVSSANLAAVAHHVPPGPPQQRAPDPPAKVALPARAAPVKACHFRLRGDLDNMQVVRDVAAEFKEARGDGIGLVVLEMDGDRWRADVVWAVAAALHLGSGEPNEARVVVYLNDPRDGRVGGGQAALGLLASACWIGPRTRIAGEPADNVRDLAPDGTDWERIDRELQGGAWVNLQTRGGTPELAAWLLSGSQSVWVVDDGRGEGSVVPVTTLQGTPADSEALRRGGPVQIIEPVAGGTGASVRIDAETAVGLALARGVARRVGEITGREGRAVVMKASRGVESGLSAAREGLARDLNELDRAIERADAALHGASGGSYADREARRRRAGQEALDLIDGAPAAVARCERTVERYPELLRTPVPGRTAVGRTTDSFASRWGYRFQDLRDDLTRIAARAREYADR